MAGGGDLVAGEDFVDLKHRWLAAILGWSGFKGAAKGLIMVGSNYGSPY